MRKSFFLYLFAFALLVIVIQYVNADKMLNSANERIAELEEGLVETEAARDSLIAQNTGLTSFSLMNNEEAMSYFENRGFEAGEVAQLVEAEIIGQNSAEQDNPLVPYEGMEGPMRINSIKLLNHKWAVASFTDGTYWGEVFLSYDLDDEGQLQIQAEKSFLYPQN